MRADFGEVAQRLCAVIEKLESRWLLAAGVPVMEVGTVYTVNSLGDVVADDGVTTLREALAAANSNGAATADVPAGSATGMDRITFDLPALEAQAGAGKLPRIVLSGTALPITDHTEILGPGADLLIIDGNGQSSVIVAEEARIVRISGLTITGGSNALGGAGISHANGTLVLTQVKVAGNQVWSENGSEVGGGGIASRNGHLVLQDSEVSGNSIRGSTHYMLGGGVYADLTDVTMVNVLLMRNSISTAPLSGLAAGGGLYVDDGNAEITNLVASGNVVRGYEAQGSAVAFDDGGMFVMTNSTIAGNSCLPRAIFYAFASAVDLGTTGSLYNSIVSPNYQAGPNPSVYPVPAGSNNLIDTDPGFIRSPSAGGDEQWGTADDDLGDLRLDSFSPAIDAGTNVALPAGISTDVASRPRVINGTVDIGAYEGSDSEITLSSYSVAENQPWGTLVGLLSTTLAGDSVTYSLADGAGLYNWAFEIAGNELRTGTRFNYEQQSSVRIRLRAVNSAGIAVERTVPIYVTDVTTPQVIQINGDAGDNRIEIGLYQGRYTLSDGSVVDPDEVLYFSIAGGAGDDSITIAAGVPGCSIIGQGGNDTIFGGDGNDTIYGGDDRDWIDGGAGSDTLYGNFGDDTIVGGDGEDSIMGGLGADSIHGGIGNDWIFGGNQQDTLYGDEGDDHVEGKGKADEIHGGAGNDTLTGGAGEDLLYGDAGDDRLESDDNYVIVGVPGAFGDAIWGGDGADTLLHDDHDTWLEVENVLG